MNRMNADDVPAWERAVIERDAAQEDAAAAIRAATAILNAFDRGIIDFPPQYMADTLRMVLTATKPRTTCPCGEAFADEPGHGTEEQLRERAERKVNQQARFLAIQQDDHGRARGVRVDGEDLPAIRIADILVFAYVRDGKLCVSVDLDEAQGYWGEIVPIRVAIQGKTVFEADKDGDVIVGVVPPGFGAL